MHFLDALRLHLSVIPRRARVCLHICGGEKWRETRDAMSRVSFGSSDIQATYYGARSRSFSPSVGSEEDFLLLVFLPPPLSPPLCPFSSLPRSQLTPLSILRALTRVPLHAAAIVGKETSTGARNSHHGLFFPRPRLYPETDRGFASKGVMRLRER